MVVVAEGVETFEELAYLQAATRIRHVQGYYFAKPFFLTDGEYARQLAGAPRSMSIAREEPERRSSRSGGERCAGRS
jgi:cyclic di-GMP phosphodiesterase Gmr